MMITSTNTTGAKYVKNVKMDPIIPDCFKTDVATVVTFIL